jgi:competence protein ComEA
VRSGQRDDALAAQLVAARLAYVLGDHQPRRAAKQHSESAPSQAAGELDGTPARDVDRIRYQTEEGSVPNQARFSRLHVLVVCALLLVGLVLGVVALLRARPVALAIPQTTVSISASQPFVTPREASASPSSGPRMVVHVLGAVRRPGLVELPERSRVSDAIDAAGGLRSSAAPGELNLAQLVSDGQQIVIGSQGDPGGEIREGGGGAAGGAGSPSPSTQLDLNTATGVQLDTLPGVGPVTAERILSWRNDHGRFRRVEELQEVEGIGPKTYAQIAPHVRV